MIKEAIISTFKEEIEKSMTTETGKSHYFDHEADIGIIGFGNTVTEAFISGAQAVFSLMSSPEEIKETNTVTFEFDEPDIEFAFVEWLNLLIAHAHKDKLIFKSFKLSHNDNHWTGEATGEHWRETLTRGTEVKGATLTALSVKKNGALWEARCVVDV